MAEKPLDKEPKPSPWTPEMVREILSGITDLADRFLTLEEGRLKHKIQKSETEAKAGWSVLGIMLIFLGIIVALMAWLTFADKVSGDALLFLTGTIVGWVLSIVYRHLFPPIFVTEED